MIGSRSPEKLADWKATHTSAHVGSFAETAAFADLVVLAVKGSAATEVLARAGAANLNGKTIIDTTNPIADTPPDNGVLKFFTSLEESLMEHLQGDYPDAHFVKSFSCVGNARMVNPVFNEGTPTMFICGDDQAAKETVVEILTKFGWESADMGGAKAARAIEPLCMLWCIPGFLRGEWGHAFALVKA